MLPPILKPSIYREELTMPQSRQDDLWEAITTSIDTTYRFLLFVGCQRKLNQDELYLLERITPVAALLEA
jgi:hypothetical protein